MNRSTLLISAALCAATSLVSSSASAQSALAENSRRLGAVVNLGGSIGVAGGGGSALRINPEFLMSFGQGMRGPGIGVGIDLLIAGAFGLGANGRFLWNFQPVDNLALLITPYAGLGFGAIFAEDPVGTLPFLSINFGAEVRLVIVNRVLLGLRPLGFQVPIYFGSNGGAGFSYDVGLSVGVTF